MFVISTKLSLQQKKTRPYKTILLGPQNIYLPQKNNLSTTKIFSWQQKVLNKNILLQLLNFLSFLIKLYINDIYILSI